MNKEKVLALGYRLPRFNEKWGWCGLEKMMFTTGLWYGIDEYFRQGRFCYPSWKEAAAAIQKWTFEELPPGAWSKHKGAFEIRNHTTHYYLPAGQFAGQSVTLIKAGSFKSFIRMHHGTERLVSNTELTDIKTIFSNPLNPSLYGKL